MEGQGEGKCQYKDRLIFEPLVVGMVEGQRAHHQVDMWMSRCDSSCQVIETAVAWLAEEGIVDI